MTDIKQLAEKEAEKYANTLPYGKHFGKQLREATIEIFKLGINSKSVELKVVEATIYTLQEVGKTLSKTVSFSNAATHKYISLMLEQLETQREAIINEINKGE
jgi:hypothetical protein